MTSKTDKWRKTSFGTSRKPEVGNFPVQKRVIKELGGLKIHFVNGDIFNKFRIGCQSKFKNYDLDIPIFTPSSGRAAYEMDRRAYLNITKALTCDKTSTAKTYCQLVFVKEAEVEDYKKHYPSISFVELPKRANALGVGAPRYWMLEFAKNLDIDKYFSMDDSTWQWMGTTMADEQSDEQFPGKAFHYRC